MTTGEIVDRCDIPLSSAYHKLERLTDASMIDERVEARADGHHTSKYVLNIEAVLIALSNDQRFGLESAHYRGRFSDEPPSGCSLA